MINENNGAQVSVNVFESLNLERGAYQLSDLYNTPGRYSDEQRENNYVRTFFDCLLCQRQ